MSELEYLEVRTELVKHSLSTYIIAHRDVYGIEGCEDPILIAAEKLLEELKRERN